MKKLLSPLLLLSLVCLFGCSDDEEELNAAAKLPNKRWMLTEFTTESFFGDTDVYAEMDDCEKDNFFEFNANGTLLIDEGPAKCATDDPQQVQGTWQVKGNTLILSGIDFGLPTSSVEVKITEASENRIKGTFEQKVQNVPISGSIALSAM